MRLALVTNMPAPYRVPVFDRIAQQLGDAFQVIYMERRERDRRWDVPALNHAHVYLRGTSVGARNVQLRTGMLGELRSYRPDVVITGGLNPPMLVAWSYTRVRQLAHVAMSDGWLGSEAELSAAHRAVRRVVYGRSEGFIGASEKTLELFRAYGARDNLVVAPLAVDNAAFAHTARPLSERPFDLLFAGNLIARKQPLFFADVVSRLAQLRSRVRVLVIGDGELRPSLEHALRRIPNVEYELTGFLQQRDLPAAYARARVLCFPTLNDPWGVVANEACASGMPAITCDRAGCAGELVRHGDTGLVLPLDAERWARELAELLSAPERLAQLGSSARAAVQTYNFDAAATAMLVSCLSAARRDRSR